MRPSLRALPLSSRQPSHCSVSRPNDPVDGGRLAHRVDRQGSAAIVRPASQDYRLTRRMTRECPCGGTGRRARLKIEFRKECWFDSGQGHHEAAPRRSSPFVITQKAAKSSPLRFWRSLSRSRQPGNWRRQPVSGALSARCFGTPSRRRGQRPVRRKYCEEPLPRMRSNHAKAAGHRSQMAAATAAISHEDEATSRGCVRCRRLERWWPSDPGPEHLMAHVVLRIRFRSADASRFGHDAAPV